MPKKVQRLLVLGAAGIAAYVALVVNIAKWSAHPGFSFGEREMVHVLSEFGRRPPWVFSQNGVQYKVELHLERVRGATPVRHALLGRATSVAFACEGRSFVQTASACYDTTTLPLVGTAILSRRESAGWRILLEERTDKAYLIALGTRLGPVDLRVRTQGMTLSFGTSDARAFVLNELWAEGLGPAGVPVNYRHYQ